MTIPSPPAGEGDSANGGAGRGVILRTHAKAMRSAMTDAEAQLWHILRAKRLDAFKFRRQQPIGAYIVDFVCFAERLIIEADGAQHIENDADAKRAAWLEGQGFRVLRFWNGEVVREPEAVAGTMYDALVAPSPRSAAPSRPLPPGERV